MNLEAVYPVPGNPAIEYSFEELRAKHRGLLEIDWSKVPREQKQLHPEQRRSSHAQSPPKHLQKKGFAIFQDENAAAQDRPVVAAFDQENILPMSEQQRSLNIFHDDAASHIPFDTEQRPPAITIDSSLKVVPLRDENEENRPPSQRDADIAKRLRKEERANRTRKIKLMEKEIQNETQTSMSLQVKQPRAVTLTSLQSN